jgi:hypothetical protein
VVAPAVLAGAVTLVDPPCNPLSLTGADLREIDLDKQVIVKVLGIDDRDSSRAGRRREDRSDYTGL